MDIASPPATRPVLTLRAAFTGGTSDEIRLYPEDGDTYEWTDTFVYINIVGRPPRLVPSTKSNGPAFMDFGRTKMRLTWYANHMTLFAVAEGTEPK